MPRKGYRPENTISALIFVPKPLHKTATEHVRTVKQDRAPGYSLQQLILDALEQFLKDKPNQ